MFTDPAVSAPPRRGPSRRTLLIAAGVAGCIAVVVVAAGLLGRAHDASQIKTWTSAQAIPTVRLVSPAADPAARPLTLPGTLQAFYSASIYSRVSGYVRAWYVDIGAQVKAGQLLATIDTPELDQQLVQARADLASARANSSLAEITARRWTALLSQDAVSKQESDEKSGDFVVKKSQVAGALANVDRLLALKGFSRIVAPFAGVVTARKTDIGALVNAGAGANSSSELFDVGEVDKLRLYVSVPQSQSARVGPSSIATLKVPEYAGKIFHATLTTTSNSVSAATGTLLVELLVDNSDGALKAGDYAQVTFGSPGTGSGDSGILRLPSSALLFRKAGMEAAVVGPDSRVRLRPVAVGRDLGTSIEINSGLSPSDRVIDNPADSLADGQLVRVVTPAAGSAPGSGHDPG
jgi:multidrug efflux system membrane fusion protein